MTYRAYDRNSSGIVFFGTNRSDQTFESNSNFTIGDNYLNAANLSVDGELYVNNFQFNSGVTIDTGVGLSGGGFLPLGSSLVINLADTSVSSGVYGSASQIPTFTVDSQGRLTDASNIEIDLSASGITGLEDYVNDTIFNSGKFLDSSSVNFTVIDDTSVSADVIPGLSGEILSSNGSTVLWIENPSGNLQSQITQNVYDIAVVSGIASSGFVLPTGGLEGQILYKVTDSTDELAWIDNYATEFREIIKNDSGDDLSKGTVVMATGAVGDRIQIAPAIADGSVEARYMFGVLSEDVDNGQEGYVTLVGPIKGISTIGLPLGTVLWIDPDNPGGLTSTQPSSPNLQMSVAIVTNGNANNGRIFVRMWEQQPGLHELHDVNVDNGLASGDLISYDSSNGTWINIENPSGNLQSQITQNASDIAVVSGIVNGTPSGIAFFGSDGDLTNNSNFTYKQSNGVFKSDGFFNYTEYDYASHSLKIGLQNTSSYKNQIAIGKSNYLGFPIYSDGKGQIAIGFNNYANGAGGISIGYETISNPFTISIGASASGAIYGVCIGHQAKADGHYGVAIGKDSYAFSSSNYKAVAIGNNARVAVLNNDGGGVAIGEYSYTNANGVAIGNRTSSSRTRVSIFTRSATSHGNQTFSCGGPENFGNNSYSEAMHNVYFGAGYTHTVDMNSYYIDYYGTHGTGVDIGGMGLRMRPGRGTGAARGGNFEIDLGLAGSTGSTFNTYHNVFKADASDGSIYLLSAKSSTKPLIVKGAPAQSANLQEWQNSAGSTLAYVDAAGNASFKDMSVENLSVSGTFTYVNSSNVTIADKQLELGSQSGIAVSGDAFVDDGGIVLKSTDGDKQWIWKDATDSWYSSENVSINAGKYLIFGDATLQTTAYTGQDVTLSGVLQPQITQNADDIATVSGLLSDYVPYSGATQDVDLGSNGLTAAQATLVGGTVTSSTPVIDATQTWNDEATTFTGMLLNVTDTASTTFSNWVDLQSSGTRFLSISKHLQGGPAFQSPNSRYRFTFLDQGKGARGVTIRLPSSSNAIIEYSGSSIELWDLYWRSNKHRLESKFYATELYVPDNHILEQRNSTNAQTFRLYNTYTSSTSFENLQLQWNTNEARIGTSVGSAGGTQRSLVFGSWDSAGVFTSCLSLAIGGTATFDNQIVGIAGTPTAPTYTFSGDLNTGIYSQFADQLRMSCGGADILALTTSIAAFYKPVRTDLIYGIANILEVRNSTNAQTFNIYNTYTSSTSYERGFMRWNSNVFEIGTEAGSGGGSPRNTLIKGKSAYLMVGDNGVTSSSDILIAPNSSLQWRSGSTVRNKITSPSDGEIKFRTWWDTGWVMLNCGTLTLNEVPTSDPATDGAVWNNGGFLNLSSTTPYTGWTYSPTWNDGATTFTGLKLDVTDTASASASLLMDLQVGGSSKFAIKKTGTVISSNIYSAPKSNQKGYLFGEDTNWGLMYAFNGWLNLQVSSLVGYRFYSNGLIQAYPTNITIQPGASSVAQSAILTGNNVNVVDGMAGQAIVKGGDKTSNNGSGGYVSIYGGSSYGQDIPSSGDVTISAGRSTGSGLGASIILRTSSPGISGTTINSSIDRVTIDSYGDVGIGESLPDAQLHIVNDTASEAAVIVQGAAAQSANLQEWQNSNGDILSYIGGDGSIHASTGNTIYDYNLVVHSGDSYFRDAVYIGQERDQGSGPSATLNLNSYNNSQIILQNHGLWTKYRIWSSLGSLTFQDISVNTDSGFRFIPRLNGITRFNNGFGLIGSTTNYTNHTAFELRPVNVSDFACYDISFRFRQTYADSTQFEKFLFKKNGDFLASGDGLFLGNLSSSGTATSGVYLYDNTPTDTTDTLYNNSGVLYFDGSPVNTDTDTTYTAGSGLTLVDTQFNVYGGSGHFVELNVEGPFTATTKSFLINHPLHSGMKLQYGSLEGPENGVYVRGTTNSKVIDLPDYWRELVDETSVTVTLTPLNEFQPLCVKHKDNRHVIVGGVYGEYDYVVYGERKDVSKLKVEWWA